jgi:carbon-monoxide dehydrogenase medium subunit
MFLPEFEYHAPLDLDGACQLLWDYAGRASVLAGGTDLLVDMKTGGQAPERVVSLERLKGLRRASPNGDGLRVGSLVTAADLAASPDLSGSWAALSEAAAGIGSPLIRNRATIGGNLCQARPAADLAPPLLVLGADLVLRSGTGVRTVAVDRFFVGPGQADIRHNEILIAVDLPPRRPRSASAFVKLGRRSALERSIASAAAWVELSEDMETIVAARTALGAVGPKPTRSPHAEALLVGRPADSNTILDAARSACEDASPRGRTCSIEYSVQMTEVLTRRALETALGRARVREGRHE